ncbi:hypothetical protein [Pseudoalteromonas sp. TB64]|uniref:hypothetical protein n=1 Tax=Pseudoalteromonas sp. TB64 TaxID=1938600 RepID=UPI0003FC7FF4|nr:hypothetical protein [Pseudoalteromonas sp. TB64]
MNAKNKKDISSRHPDDYAHMSLDAQQRLLFTKRIPKNKREQIILKVATDYMGNRLYFLCYLFGFIAFMPWVASGWLGLIFTVSGKGYVLFRYIRMDDSFTERIKYERESPVKSISQIHNEHVINGLLLSTCSIALNGFVFLILFIIKK